MNSWKYIQRIHRTNFQGWSRSQYRGIQTMQLFLSVTTWMVSEGYSLSGVYLRSDANVRWDWQSGSNSVAENGSGWKTRGQLAQRHPRGASSQILEPRTKDTRSQWLSTRFNSIPIRSKPRLGSTFQPFLPRNSNHDRASNRDEINARRMKRSSSNETLVTRRLETRRILSNRDPCSFKRNRPSANEFFPLLNKRNVFRDMRFSAEEPVLLYLFHQMKNILFVSQWAVRPSRAERTMSPRCRLTTTCLRYVALSFLIYLFPIETKRHTVINTKPSSGSSYRLCRARCRCIDHGTRTDRNDSSLEKLYDFHSRCTIVSGRYLR